MKRKFTFLLMALLALAGFKSWGQQRGYTYTKVTSFPSNPDPTKEYVLGYENAGTYYLYASGTAVNAMTLSSNQAEAKTFTFGTALMYGFMQVNVAKCDNLYLSIYTSGANQGVGLGSEVFSIGIVNGGYINDGNSSRYLYHDGMIIKASTSTSNTLSFFERTGSAAPTYAVTVTSDTEGCTASADKASYEEGETVTLSYEADAFHYFVEWQSSDVTITDNTFEMPANEVSVTAHFAAKPTHSITATVNPENAGTASVTYQSNTITEAPAGAVLNLSAIANPGFDFVSWTIGGEVVSTSANYNYTMPDNDVAIVANFGEHQFLHVNIDPNIVGGTITVNPSECDPGATVTVTPNAASGYQYVYGNITVTDANGQPVYVYQDNPNSTFEMPNTDVIVSATFTKLYSVSMGTVQNGSAYPAQGSGVAGSTIFVYVTPNTGCEVISVIANYEGGSITASFEDVYNDKYLYYFDMPAADVTVNVVCAQTYTVSYTQPTGGTISVSPTTNVPASQSVSISIDHIQAHYSFDYDNYKSKISVKDASQEAVIVNKESDGHYYFLMPASNVTVSVIFDEDPKNNISVIQPVGCTIQVSPSENVYANETVYLSYYNVQTGYKFVEWVVKNGEETITPEYDYYYGYYFTMPASENVTVTATVEALTAYTVNIAEGIIGGSVSARTNNDDEAPINAYEGEYVYLDNTPETGYQFVSYTVTSECETVEVYYDYYFIMPDCDVTVSATFALAPQDLTVNEGVTTLQDIPFNTYYSDGNYTKSQFIISSNDLINMFDGTITNLTFFNSYSSYFAFTGTWNVYMKEVDYTTIQNSDYFPTSEEDLVYAGTLSLNSGMLEIALTHPYTYSDGNLMLCFEQTSLGNATNNPTNWYGVTAQSDVCRTGYDYSSGGGYHYNYNFLPKTTFRYMPSANPQARYAITVSQPEVGGNISASKAFAVEGTTISLTATPAEGYVLDSWVVTDGNGSIEVTDNQFAVRTSDVTVTATFKTLPRYEIAITPNEHGIIRVNNEETPDEDGYLEGTRINLSAQGNEGWTLADDGYTVTPANPTVTVEIQQEHGSYYFEMPACNVTVSATFRELEQYTITYHVNGVETERTFFENQYVSTQQPETLPAGTEWYSWVTEDFDDAYTTIEPERYWGDYPTENMDLYAVFKFTEIIPLEGESSWSQIYNESELEDGDRFILANSIYSYEDYNIHYYMMCQRDEEYGNHFTSTEGYPTYSSTSYRYEFTNLPSNVTILTAEKLEGSNWKFHFVDAYKGENTLANVDGSNLVPYDLWPWGDACETWNVEWGQLKSTFADYQYVSLRNDLTFNIDSYNQAYIYREVKPTQTNYYYMTKVLGFGGADEHIAANTEATNVVIAKNAKLTIDDGATLNVEGICLSASHDAAQLVVADGGQLIHNNAGTVATFEKNIIGYNSKGSDGWYFIANPTANTTVNLSGSGSYDLYTFNPAAAAEWHNEQYIDEVQIPEENIAISRETGYLYANAANFTLKFEGELIPSGEDQTIDLVYYNGVEPGREFPGFNLIGNPFSCTAYISGDFDMYKLVNGSDVEISEDYTVAPCEAFFVEATEVGETVTLSTTAPTEKSRIMPIVVNSDSGETLDRAILHLEGTRNSHKFMMNPDRTNISFAKNGERFASVSRGDETEIPMNFTADHKGSYTISFNTENFEEEYLHLIDVVSGDNIDLLVTPNYTFEADADEYASRFRIVFGTTDINDNPATSSAPFVYISNGNLVINNVEGTASMQIVDMLGRIVRIETVSGSYNRPHNLKAGAYVITLDGRAQRIVIE